MTTIKYTAQLLALFYGLCVINVMADSESSQEAIFPETFDQEEQADQADQAQETAKGTFDPYDDDPIEDCVQEFESEHWLDKTQAHTFTGMCKTVRWFDGLFGSDAVFDDDKFGGRITIGFKVREDDGFDERVRVRIKSKLPNLSSRANAFIGRVDEDEFVSDSRQNPDSLASTAIRRQDEDESEWLIGLGYSDPKKRKKGLDYSIGAKISSGLNPYARTRYRYKFKMPENHFLRASQTLFWQNDDGYGTTNNINYSHLIGENDILEWGNTIKFTQDEDQWEWINGANWYHRLQNNHAIVSRAFIRGEEENSESIPEYGVTLVYRMPFMRDWVFLEASLEHRWIKDSDEDEREESLGAGIQVIMEFGETARDRSY
jgi:hypothetical protein